MLPAQVETGAHQMYKFIAVNLTFPLLVGLGVLYVPWNDLIAAFTIPYFVICAASVLAMVASGWFVGRWLNMYPVEAAIVTACHSGLGGTGDVAILSASDRIALMPFSRPSIDDCASGRCAIVTRSAYSHPETNNEQRRQTAVPHRSPPSRSGRPFEHP
jgi:Na+/citrate or Na+/malate symporter